MAFDFENDEKLACLPLVLRQRMQATQEARIAAGLTANNGMTYKDAATRDKVNAAIARRSEEV
jgi:hypothetical protein